MNDKEKDLEMQCGCEHEHPEVVCSVRAAMPDENVTADLSDFFKVIGLDEDDYSEFVGEADTLAGFLLELKGDFPKKDEELVCKDLVFKVMEKKERRLSGIRVTVRRQEQHSGREE